MTKPYLDTLQGNGSAVPFWYMRQAGRYLPEYREVRKSAGNFLDLCYTPSLATEVTLQPIRRYRMDAAILFSDILVIPDALGRKVHFEEALGPRLDPLTPEDVKTLSLDTLHNHVKPVYDTVSSIRSALKKEGFNHTALIGFSGAPWTLACYMIEGQGSRDFQQVRQWAITHPSAFSRLMDLLTEAVTAYCARQIDAGAEAIQLFDSWAGVLPAEPFSTWVIDPTARIVSSLKQHYPHIPVTGFPRMSGWNYLAFSEKTGVDAVSVDYTVPLSAMQQLQRKLIVQGNLDPLLLAHDREAALTQAKAILQACANGRFIFNLGHGIVPKTPPEHVAALSETLRQYTQS